ncbi:hypothetical protein Ddc_21880 [Ditylenchus destructor]|nr:hypothetical protein Ddc_21880 [Ditylenchus destructor]
MDNVHFPLIDCKVLRNVKVIEINCDYHEEEIELNSWLQLLEQSGVKHIVVLRDLQRERIDIVVERLSKDFSSAVSPNAFKIVFVQLDVKLTEFQATNKTSGEKLELKEGFPTEFSAKYQNNWVDGVTKYTLERSSI